MQTVAEIDEMLNEWEYAHPRLTPKTRKPRTGKAAIPAWHAKLVAMEDGTDSALAPAVGVLVRCKCPVLHRIAAGYWQRGRVVNNVGRRCFICGGHRVQVDE